MGLSTNAQLLTSGRTTGMGEWVTCIDVAAERGLFAAGWGDGAVIVADLATGRPRRTKKLHRERVASVVFDGGALWSAGFDGQVAGCDLETGQERLRFDAGHGRVLSLRTALGVLLTVGDDGIARVWRQEDGSEIQALDEKRFGAAYSIAATSDWIAIGYETGYVAVWKDGSGHWEYEGNLQAAGRGPLYGIAVSPTRELVAFARERRVSLHAPGEWEEIDSLPVDLACNDVQFDSRGNRLIGACSNREVSLWHRQPMVGNPYGHWPHITGGLGKGMLQGEEWKQSFICSGARFVGEDEVISSWFDGTVRLFPLSHTPYRSNRIVRLGRKQPTGWEDE